MRQLAGAALVAIALTGCDGTDDRAPAQQSWRMHAIDDRFRGANALGSGDVDGDGLTDYVTNYEFDQRYVIEFHPGRAESPARPWPTVTLLTATPPRGIDTESAALVDLDGDGSLDVVGAQGRGEVALFDGDEPGIRVIWGPPRTRVLDAGAWRDGGRVPATVERGHWHWVLPEDVDGDGDSDLLLGGRRLGGSSGTGGVAWLEVRDGARRDLSRWRLHVLDPEQPSGHGVVPGDLDGDGDHDLALANADFDTAPADEEIAWYERPADPRGRWPKHVLLREPALTTKTQVAIGDLDGDGANDVVGQTSGQLLVFRGDGAGSFRLDRIPKASIARWPSRTLRLADLDRDGRLDVLGALAHEDGVLPVTKASVWWMRNEGGGRFTTRPIRWGSGLTMTLPQFGEKWDQAHVTDVDGDGDRDVVANDEEWWVDPSGEYRFWFTPGETQSVSVVWFENPSGDRPSVCRERDGQCTVEAEDAVAIRGAWVERNRVGGASGVYLQAFGRGGTARYRLRIEGGEYELTVRLLAPARFSEVAGGRTADSVALVVAGREIALDARAVNAWTDETAVVHLPAGRHDLELRIVDPGVAVDRLVVRRAPG
jgi:hypothetical protein